MDVINFVSIIIIIFSLWRRPGRLFKDVFPYYILFGYSIHVLFLFSLNDITDTWHLLQPFRCILNLLAIHILISYVLENGMNWRQVLSIANLCIYVHSGIVIGLVFMPEARGALAEFTGFVEKSYLRSPGLTQSYGVTSILTVMPLLTVPFTYKSLYRGSFDILGLGVCIISLIFLARIGFYLAPCIICLIIIHKLFSNHLKLKHAAIIVCLLSFPYVLYLYAFSDTTHRKLQSQESSLSEWEKYVVKPAIRHSFELVTVLVRGEGSVKSFEEIENLVYHNNTISKYLFGTGFYGRGDPRTHLYTDISYAHLFSMVGTMGILTLVAFYIYPILRTASGLTPLVFVYTSILFIIIICHYKEATLLTRSLWSFSMIPYVCLLNKADKLER